ncbi:MAG: hypothetical protein LC104_07865 [Bacteroidales bacterium]|nr:hypothetical protein [Bacteroidales bacterium]
MPGDPLRHVLPGQKLEIPAAAYNAFADAARFARGRIHETGRESDPYFRQADIVPVRNNSGFALPRFAVIALAEPIIGPWDNLAEFQTRVAFEGIVPDDPPASGRFAVLLDPLDAGAIGRGIVAGVTPVKLSVDPDRLYEFAEVAGGGTSSLRNAPAGSARVLWLEESGSSERWAIVRLGDGEEHVRFQLTTPLPRCGSAEANLVLFREGRWCPVEAAITVHDSLGVVGATFAGETSGSGDGCGCPGIESVPAGTFGVARYFADSRKWEVVVLGEGCCSSSSSSSHGRSSSGVSSSGNSSSGTSSGGSSGSSSGRASDSSSWSASRSSSQWTGSSSSSGWTSGSSSNQESSSGLSAWSQASSSSSSSSQASSGSSAGVGSSGVIRSSSGPGGPGTSSGLWSSSSGTPSGPGSSGTGSSVDITETDVRCEDGKLNVYNRTVTLRIDNGGLSREEGTWSVLHQAGCCCCENCGSSSSGSSGSQVESSSGSESGLSATQLSSGIEPSSSIPTSPPPGGSDATSGTPPVPLSSWIEPPQPSSSDGGRVPPSGSDWWSGHSRWACSSSSDSGGLSSSSSSNWLPPSDASSWSSSWIEAPPLSSYFLE